MTQVFNSTELLPGHCGDHDGSRCFCPPFWQIRFQKIRITSSIAFDKRVNTTTQVEKPLKNPSQKIFAVNSLIVDVISYLHLSF